MRNKTKNIILLVILIILVLAWAPWVTDNYAIDKVTKKLGGPDAKFNYLGESKSTKDIPKSIKWFPFGKLVYFPSEAVWFITFYGDII